jgi:hypothetical protein
MYSCSQSATQVQKPSLKVVSFTQYCEIAIKQGHITHDQLHQAYEANDIYTNTFYSATSTMYWGSVLGLWEMKHVLNHGQASAELQPSSRETAARTLKQTASCSGMGTCCSAAAALGFWMSRGAEAHQILELPLHAAVGWFMGKPCSGMLQPSDSRVSAAAYSTEKKDHRCDKKWQLDLIIHCFIPNLMFYPISAAQHCTAAALHFVLHLYFLAL